MIEAINQKIFDLVYQGHFTFLDCESMTSIELKYFHTLLANTKARERQLEEDLRNQISQQGKVNQARAAATH